MSATADAARLREMITPEGVDLKLQIASGGERLSAFLLDTLFMVLFLVLMTLGLFLLGALGVIHAMDYLVLVWLLGFFVLRNFYFTAFELTLRAATPGKRIIGLRVAMRDGGPLTANAIFARNAMRELEIFLPLSFLLYGANGVDGWIKLAGLVWCGVFVFFPLLNRDRLRVGDLVGGTWVVVAPRRVLDTELTTGPATRLFSNAALDAYGIKELNILEDVLRRGDAATLSAVAARIRIKIGFDAAMPDREFLMAYYSGLRGRLETRLMFGTRRRDKHEKV
jgi:uncharacterized RDD family membrane protein YckC